MRVLRAEHGNGNVSEFCIPSHAVCLKGNRIECVELHLAKTFKTSERKFASCWQRHSEHATTNEECSIPCMPWKFYVISQKFLRPALSSWHFEKFVINSFETVVPHARVTLCRLNELEVEEKKNDNLEGNWFWRVRIWVHFEINSVIEWSGFNLRPHR